MVGFQKKIAVADLCEVDAHNLRLIWVFRGYYVHEKTVVNKWGLTLWTPRFVNLKSPQNSWDSWMFIPQVWKNIW